MTNRAKIILIGVLITLGIVGGVIFGITTHKSPQPLPEGSETPSKTDPEEQTPTSEESGTDSEENPFSEEDMASMLANGKHAAAAYVSQPKDETEAARQDRLKTFFIASSPVITSPPPVTAKGYDTGDVTSIETSWYDTGNPNTVGVLVYLTVEVNTPTDTRNENQTWQVELVPLGASWASNTITRSNLPYVRGVN